MSYITTSKLSRRRIRNRKRVLIVNCYFDYTRLSVPRPFKSPQAMAPVYLAGAFSDELVDIRLYNEQSSGPLEDENLLSWPDMLVLTGLTSAFDRMLHLTAYARTKNTNVIVVAGGSPIRAIPNYSQRFFDYCCCGDIEQMNEVITDAFGEDYVAREMLPRYDLAYWTRRFGYIETSRNCNFRCPFCALTGEGVGYQKYDLEYIRKQIIAMGKKKYVIFIDNNFYGNDRKFFLERLDLIKDMRKAGYLRSWAALVTTDFFHKDENLELVRDAGCLGLFTGIEAFDTQWLQNNKAQNAHFPQVELISKSLDAGVVFHYGLIMDV
ncbi:MAG: B12-binding domain-containing radical SAM protein, partial [bacterium]